MESVNISVFVHEGKKGSERLGSFMGSRSKKIADLSLNPALIRKWMFITTTQTLIN